MDIWENFGITTINREGMSMRKKSQTEVRFTVDEDFLDELGERLDQSKATDIVRTALTLLDWVSNEAIHGREILSADENSNKFYRLAMPELSRARAKAPVTLSAKVPATTAG